MLDRYANSMAVLLSSEGRSYQKEFYVAVNTLLEGVFIVSTFGLLVTYVYPLPYGRYTEGGKRRQVSAKLFWQCFRLFWILPLPLIYLTPAYYLSNPWNVVGLSLYCLHYFQKSMIYPRHLDHATPWPLRCVVFSLCTCTVNTVMHTFNLLNVHLVSSPGPVGYLGLVTFFTGFTINVTHDAYLANQRQVASKTAAYVIPQWGLFKWISAANYSGEILEWWGLAMFTGSSTQLIFAIFSSVLLGIRGLHHHKYYVKKFGKAYPPGRKAVIPWLL